MVRPPTTGCRASGVRRGPSIPEPVSTTSTTISTSSPISTGGTTRSAGSSTTSSPYWLDRGVAGFRIDVCNIIVKDALLRDNPPATETDPPDVQLFGQRPVYSGNRPEVHDVIRRWRQLADRYPDCVLVGETPVEPVESLAAYYGNGRDELHLAFNFPFISAPLDGSGHAGRRRGHRGGPAGGGLAGVDRLQPRHVPFRHAGGPATTRPGPGWPCSCSCASGARLSCTRVTRSDWATSWWPTRTCATHWASGTGRTTPAGTACGPRCPGGTPPVAGSPSPASDRGCRFGDLAVTNVEDQRADPGSMLHLARDLIALRRDTPDAPRPAPTGSLATAPGTWAWSRGEDVVVAVEHDRRHRCRRTASPVGCGSAPTAPGTGSRWSAPSTSGVGRPSWSSGPRAVGIDLGQERVQGRTGQAVSHSSPPRRCWR